MRAKEFIVDLISMKIFMESIISIKNEQTIAKILKS